MATVFKPVVLGTIFNIGAVDVLGPILETIRPRSAQIRSCDPDRPIAFHKRRSQSAHQIEKIRNQTVYCQSNHDINHSLGNLELKLRGRDWIKNVRLMISIHDVTMGGVATSFMSADTRASWPVQCTHTVFAHDTTRFGPNSSAISLPQQTIWTRERPNFKSLKSHINWYNRIWKDT